MSVVTGTFTAVGQTSPAFTPTVKDGRGVFNIALTGAGTTRARVNLEVSFDNEATWCRVAETDGFVALEAANYGGVVGAPNGNVAYTWEATEAGSKYRLVSEVMNAGAFNYRMSQ